MIEMRATTGRAIGPAPAASMRAAVAGLAASEGRGQPEPTASEGRCTPRASATGACCDDAYLRAPGHTRPGLRWRRDGLGGTRSRRRFRRPEGLGLRPCAGSYASKGAHRAAAVSAVLDRPADGAQGTLHCRSRLSPSAEPHEGPALRSAARTDARCMCRTQNRSTARSAIRSCVARASEPALLGSAPCVPIRPSSSPVACRACRPGSRTRARHPQDRQGARLPRSMRAAQRGAAGKSRNREQHPVRLPRGPDRLLELRPSKIRRRLPWDGFGRSDGSIMETGFVPVQPRRRAAYRSTRLVTPRTMTIVDSENPRLLSSRTTTARLSGDIASRRWVPNAGRRCCSIALR